VLLSGNDINGLFFLLYLPKLWGGQDQKETGQANTQNWCPSDDTGLIFALIISS
jgi:hypothetical protein